jgi:hypothetical protein
MQTGQRQTSILERSWSSSRTVPLKWFQMRREAHLPSHKSMSINRFFARSMVSLILIEKTNAIAVRSRQREISSSIQSGGLDERSIERGSGCFSVC